MKLVEIMKLTTVIFIQLYIMIGSQIIKLTHTKPVNTVLFLHLRWTVIYLHNHHTVRVFCTQKKSLLKNSQILSRSQLLILTHNVTHLISQFKENFAYDHNINPQPRIVTFQQW